MKNETLEEAAEHNYPNGDIWTEEQAVIRRLAFKNGAKWQAEKMYSEEDIDKQILDFKYDLKESTSTFVKQNCEGAIFGLNRLKQFKKDKL